MAATDVQLSEMKKKNKQDALKFMREHFYAKECSRFVPKPDKFMPDGEPKCYCGGTEDDHTDALQNPSAQNVFWSEQDIVKIPTNAFGKISFIGPETQQKAARYIRLSEDSDIDDVIHLLDKCWRLTDDGPELLISIVGDTKEFKLPASMKNKIFNRGLIPAAEVTKGWITTSGLHLGVAKAVGEAICESQLYYGDLGRAKRVVQCIGIAPWGFVSNKQCLSSIKDDDTLSQYRKVEYDIDPRVQKKYPVSLNPYHTHYLLIDNGIRNKECCVADFRAALEKRISDPVESGGLNIPVVCILIGGNQASITHIERNCAAGLPTVIYQGTGKAADIIAHAYRHYKHLRPQEKSKIPRHFEEDIFNRVEEAFYKNSEAEEFKKKTKILAIFQEIIDICRKPNVFLIDVNVSEDKTGTALLMCLMECQSADMEKKLRLALHWKRCDVAKARIFSDPQFKIHSPEISSFFTEALIENQLDFVKLFVDHGFAIKRYLTVAQLRNIYRLSLDKPNFLCQLLKLDEIETESSTSGSICLNHLHSFLKKITRRFKHSMYDNDSADSETFSGDGTAFEKPFQELLIWSLLLYRIDMAQYFWEQCDDPLITCLAAALLCDRLSDRAQNFCSELACQYAESKKIFETTARNLIDIAFSVHREKAIQLIHLSYEIWGDSNCMEIAAIADALEFLASTCCQSTIFNEWRLGFDASGWKIVFATFTVLPVIYCINFEGDIVTVTTPTSTVPMQCDPNDRPILKRTPSRPSTPKRCAASRYDDADDSAAAPFIFAYQVNKYRKRTLSWTHKLYKFYSSPVVTFTNHTFWYVIFLLLHAHVLLFSFRWSLTTAELMLHIWILTFFCEFIRIAICTHHEQSLKNKILEFLDFSSFAMWNNLEMLNLAISSLIFFLRWFQPTFATARLLLALNFILYMFRVYKIFMVNSYLGPKVIMMIKMTRDLLMFLLLLVVLMVSYSISSQALLHPRRLYYSGIFYDILNHGIWEIFGDLDSEITEPKLPECITSTSNETYHSSASILMDMEPAYLKARDCNVRNWSVPLLLGIYLFFGNILLVNMLIAIFASIFEDVQRHSEQIWKSLMYYLVSEHKDKPFLPPPFIVINHAYRMFRYCCGRKPTENDYEAMLREQNKEQEAKVLNVFETECRSQYLENIKQESSASPETLLKEINNNVCQINKIIADLQFKMKSIRRLKNAPFKARFKADTVANEEDQEDEQFDGADGKPTIAEPKSPTDTDEFADMIFH